MSEKTKRTTSQDEDFVGLVAQLDAELSVRDGEDHAFYHQFNGTEALEQIVVHYVEEQPVACGALKAFAPGVAEVKRMYTHPEYRSKGLAERVLAELESWGAELGYEKTILETGVKQPEAIHLYLKSGYARVPNYGPYEGLQGSRCFEKKLTP